MSIGKKLSVGKGISGIGRLAKTWFDIIQNYYGPCISNNQGDAEKMSSGVRAILGHVSSAADQPNHEDCLKDSNLWCRYQRYIANGTQYHWLMKNPPCPTIVEKVEPIFEKYGDKQFLTAVEKCYTTNANESFHYVVWSMCPKEQYNSPKEFSIALKLSMGIFNDGVWKMYSSFYKILKLLFTKNMNESMLKMIMIKSDFQSKLTIH